MLHNITAVAAAAATTLLFLYPAYLSKDHSRLGQVHEGLGKKNCWRLMWHFYRRYALPFIQQCQGTEEMKPKSYQELKIYNCRYSSSWQGAPLFQHSAQHIFPSKWYTTYECLPELVVTVPSARSTIVKKIKRFTIWLHKWSHVTFTELLSAVVKIPWHYHQFPWFFHDFPWPLLFSMTFQAWKTVFLNFMTFHDQPFLV